jgi:small nuclear ribonucleoprotein D3
LLLSHCWYSSLYPGANQESNQGATKKATTDMSVVGNNRVGIPIVLLHDAEGAVVEVETKAGLLIRGLLFEAEDQMNLYLKNCVVTGVDGVKRKTPQLYLRGCEIVFICLPDMLQHAPMFQRYVPATRLDPVSD